MTRWQEEWERKIIDFLHTMRSLDRWAFAWRSVATPPDTSPGKAAVAMKTAMRLQELRRRCESAFKQASYIHERSNVPTVDTSASTVTQQSTCLDDGTTRRAHTSTEALTVPSSMVGPLPPQILTDDTVIPFIQAARRALNDAVTTTINDAREIYALPHHDDTAS